MQLLETKKENYIGQADPYILESDGRYYIYTTGEDGIYAYSSDALLTGWKFHGMVFTLPGEKNFWAPSVIELDGKFYMYCSYEFFGDTPDQGGHREAMFVSVADHPLGPFKTVSSPDRKPSGNLFFVQSGIHTGTDYPSTLWLLFFRLSGLFRDFVRRSNALYPLSQCINKFLICSFAPIHLQSKLPGTHKNPPQTGKPLH